MPTREVFASTSPELIPGAGKPAIIIVGNGRTATVETARRLTIFSVAVIDARASDEPEPPGGPWDIVVVALCEGSMAALEWSLAHWPALGRPEMVFVCGDLATDPLAKGLGAAGVRYVIGEQTAADWLLEHAAALTAFTRARRALLEATERLPRSPCPPAAGAEEEPLGLFQAEQQFRSTYIQMLLARSTSRREAAFKARIAYRTFCHILEKLGISSRKLRGQKLAIADDPSLSLTKETPEQKYDSRESPENEDLSV